jgi:hypothetical protein
VETNVTKTAFRYLTPLFFGCALALSACGGTGGDQVNAAAPDSQTEQVEVASVSQDSAKTTPLADLLPTGESSALQHGALKINGTTYDNTVYGHSCGRGWVGVYDLNRSYTKLATTVGVDDNSPEGDTVNVTVKADGATVANVSTQLGQPAPLEVGLTDVLRLRIEVTGGSLCDEGTGFGTAIGLGDAQLTAAA